ncbi:DUF4349 domain-containing protein [Sphingomonas sp. Root241]|uniref:DUF4349 domain-containing protein n=1 Tax=Sphingomonas sp. Root241 TaxID=1736501 RepID=UPI0006F26FFB|nr:DUF4349 domain-containing protein [Sphingomonas sp. Root241]KRC82429.1 hypothetical protein ASE13_09105 [Sphingomonas sp. Root241]
MRFITLFAAAATLTACSAAENAGSTKQDSTVTSFTPEESAAADRAMTDTPAVTRPATPGTAKSDAPAKLPISIPKLAYAYALTYLLPGDKIAATQDAHRDMCEEMGPARCQLLALERGIGNEQSNNASLKLRVATTEARRFQILLEHDVTQAGGRTENAKIATDEVSKQIVDSEARVRQRELLVARLTEMLRKRQGTPADLLAAERSVTQAQEELDQAKSWLSELQGRVAMSEFDIRYGAIAPSATAQGVGAQLGEAVQGSGAVFLIGLRFVLSLVIYLLPWLLLAAIPVLLIRRFGKRRPAAVGG